MQALADRLDVSVALGIQAGNDILYVGYRVSRKVATLRGPAIAAEFKTMVDDYVARRYGGRADAAE